MRAAILEGPRQLIVQDTPPPTATDSEVIVAVEAAGVCGSDVPVFQGTRPVRYPLILGHEAIGRVIQAGRTGPAEGARVVIEPNIPCGHCAICRRGRGNVCPNKRSLGLNAPGVFAERVAVPSDFVHPVPVEISARDAVALEPLAVAVHAFGMGQARAGESVAIIGCGTEGLLLTQVAVAMGAHVLAADMREDRLAAARRLGAERTLQVGADQSAEELGAHIAREWSPTVVFECAGAAPAVELALHAITSGGRVVLVGLAAKPVPLVPLRFVRRGLTLAGSLIYDHPGDFQRTMELVRSGRVHPGSVITHVLGLEDAAEAVQLVAAGQTGKATVDIAGVLEPPSRDLVRAQGGQRNER
jgi:2-desacetyl-2-hydroxyethyl bacteriochlorophyllide A dehydrogenase